MCSFNRLARRSFWWREGFYLKSDWLHHIFGILWFIDQFRNAGFLPHRPRFIWWPDHAAQSDVTDADFSSRKAIPSDGHVGNDDGGWSDSWSDFRGNH